MTPTRSIAMRRAWAKMRQHMQRNRFSRFMMARCLREVWADVRAAQRGLTVPAI
ncbi:hypothetical protein [Limimaricola cinnabarinus]|uniref:hypothetical protein n=1 Tax=Limimaricola cinnabarinus TaxID=1125964 RepID=UPI002491115A|nr:hypothetical protein [Limimaricola cinnabarinus]